MPRNKFTLTLARAVRFVHNAAGFEHLGAPEKHMKRVFFLTLTAVLAGAAIFAGIYSSAGGKPGMTATRDLSDAEVRRRLAGEAE